MYVCIDTREQNRQYDALKYYEKQKEISLAYTGTLPTGDYLFYKRIAKVFRVARYGIRRDGGFE